MENNQNLLNYSILLNHPDRLVFSAWIEHIPFGMFIIDITRPKILVELGTHMGVSYCAFCQAIKQLSIENRSYAIDTWEGDEQAGFYGPEVLADLRNHHDPRYGQFSSLVKNTFDKAKDQFSDGSIDLLHIDGLHTYEAVKHDFENWLPKMSSHGVILFHDTNVREGDFGVWKLWDEVKEGYPSFEFTHGHGLGVLVVGKDYPHSLDILLTPSIDISNIRNYFYILGNKLTLEITIQAVKDEYYQKIQSLSAEVVNRDQKIQSLSAEVVNRDQKIQSLSAEVVNRDQKIQSLSAEVVNRDQKIQSLEKHYSELDQIKKYLENQINQLSMDFNQTKIELMNVYFSKSWKMTSPLRKIKQIILNKNEK